MSKPRLYSNGGIEDKGVISLLMKAGIPFTNLGPTSTEPTPILEYGYWKFTGLKEIQLFIEGWKKEKLPPLDLYKQSSK